MNYIQAMHCKHSHLCYESPAGQVVALQVVGEDARGTEAVAVYLHRLLGQQRRHVHDVIYNDNHVPRCL